MGRGALLAIASLAISSVAFADTHSQSSAVDESSVCLSIESRKAIQDLLATNEKTLARLQTIKSSSNEVLSLSATIAKQKKDLQAPACNAGNRALDPSVVAYYQNLLKTYRSGGHVALEDFNKTFLPVEAALDPSKENYLKCSLHPDESCVPDTFYSWGPPEKAEAVKQSTPDQTIWNEEINGGRSVWMIPSSISTYCYGRLPLRFHFRPGYSPEAIRGGVSNTWTNLMDWTLNKASPLESVSYGQPEHFDEIITEIQRRLDLTQAWKDSRVYRPSAWMAFRDSKEKLIQGCVAERGIPLAEAEMVKNLMVFVETVLNGSGWIHTQKCPGCSVDNHFKTTWPTFFNPK